MLLPTLNVKSCESMLNVSFIQLQIIYFAYKLKLMGCVNDKVQKNYKPKEGGPPSTQVGYSQNGQVVGPNRKSNSMNNSNSLNVTKPENIQKQESKISDKPPIPKQKTNTLNAQQSNVYINNSSIIKEEAKRSQIKAAAQPQQSETNIKMSQSSIKLIQTSVIKSELMISALHVQGFQGDQFHGKKVKKFNIQAEIPEKDLIKESNYFDQSNGDLQMRPKVTTKYADFSVGNFQQINTFPIKTYLFDRPLNDRIVA